VYYTPPVLTRSFSSLRIARGQRGAQNTARQSPPAHLTMLLP